MLSPFFKLTCGCVGMPLNRPSKGHKDCVDVLNLKDCETGEPTFTIRPQFKDKVNSATRLGEEETNKLIERLTLICGLGWQTLEAESKKQNISDLAKKYKEIK